jgi:N6-L-threonylcarbamoyladenine synthase
MEIIGTTLDDAIGEAFDKCGKILGLNYPAGPEIDKLFNVNKSRSFSFPIPKVKNFDLSFSGFKTSVINFVKKNTEKDKDFIKKNLIELCSSIQFTLIEIITQKVIYSVNKTNIKTIAIGGGVTANSFLRKKLRQIANENNWKLFIPNIEYTTDNAAMIGIVGYHKFLKKNFSDLSLKSSARLKF